MAANGRSAIVIGASRGLGLGLAGELARRGWQVVATVRAASPALNELAAAHPGIEVETADVAIPASIDALAGRLTHRSFDLVFVNAGVSGPAHASASQVTRDELGMLMMTNAAGPIRTARALLPLLTHDGTVAFMTSSLGSVAGNTSGGLELYRASKAALNMLSRSFSAVDMKGRSGAVLSIHPGWVKTDMGGPGAAIEVETSITGIADVLEVERSPGHFYLDFEGNTIPW